MKHAYIYDAIRTPRGKARPDGGLHDLSPYELLSTLYAALEQRTGFNPADIDDVILGCATQYGELAGNIAKTSTLYHGWPAHISGLTVNRFCSSGIDAINFSAMKVMTGVDEMNIAGGIEMLSRIPMLADKPAPFLNPELASKIGMYMMGCGADLIATKHGFNREAVDSIALESQQRAAHARASGHYKSIIPVVNAIKNITVEQDEIIRPHTTAEGLAAMAPAFVELGESGTDADYLKAFPELGAVHHVHTAGNSPAMADGASALLIGSAAVGEKLGIKPRAHIRAMANLNGDHRTVLTGCVDAVRELMNRESLTSNDIDLFEIHEAFAATMLYGKQELGIDSSKLNVNGGCIALGHPLGATGAIMTGTLLDELERRDLKSGIVSAAGAAGAGSALLIERC